MVIVEWVVLMLLELLLVLMLRQVLHLDTNVLLLVMLLRLLLFLGLHVLTQPLTLEMHPLYE